MVTSERLFRLEAGWFIVGQVGTMVLLNYHHLYGLGLNLPNGLTVVTPEKNIKTQGSVVYIWSSWHSIPSHFRPYLWPRFESHQWTHNGDARRILCLKSGRFIVGSVGTTVLLITHHLYGLGSNLPNGLNGDS